MQMLPSRDGMRIAPAMPPTAYKTYEIRTPQETHFRSGTCAEVGCPPYLHGWRVRVEGLPPELLHIARSGGRRYTEMQVAEGESWLVFEAGQPCFRAAEHQVRLDRPELYVVRGGDWRGNPSGAVQRVSAQAWTDDFGEHQANLAARMERG